MSSSNRVTDYAGLLICGSVSVRHRGAKQFGIQRMIELEIVSSAPGSNHIGKRLNDVPA